MRISDWSSDVCSSDLIDTAGQSGAEQNCYGEKPIERIETDEALERITSSPVRIAYILCVGEGHDEAAEHEKEINAEPAVAGIVRKDRGRSEEHTSELPSLMRSSYAVFCLKKKK